MSITSTSESNWILSEQRSSETPRIEACSLINVESKITPKNINANQRQTFDHTNELTFGYFILQDSSFGNSLLPVIPRIPAPEDSSDKIAKPECE